MVSLSTLTVDVEVVILLFARLPRSICTEMLACDKSMPELCSACVRVFSNLSKALTYQFTIKNPISSKGF